MLRTDGAAYPAQMLLSHCSPCRGSIIVRHVQRREIGQAGQQVKEQVASTVYIMRPCIHMLLGVQVMFGMDAHNDWTGKVWREPHVDRPVSIRPCTKAGLSQSQRLLTQRRMPFDTPKPDESAFQASLRLWLMKPCKLLNEASLV